MTSMGLRPALLFFLLAGVNVAASISARKLSNGTPDRSSQADRPSRKSPQAACPHQKSRIDPSYPHPRILLCGLDSHKFRKGRYFSSCPQAGRLQKALGIAQPWLKSDRLMDFDIHEGRAPRRATSSCKVF